MVSTVYYQDMTRMNTFGMKVKARCFVEYDSVADLVDIEFDELARPVLHIGGGSNLLFTDDFKGTVLHSKINFIEILESPSSRPSDESSSCPSDESSSCPSDESSSCPSDESFSRPSDESSSCPSEESSSRPSDESSSRHSDESFIRHSEEPFIRHSEERSDVGIYPPVLVSVGAGVVFDDFCAWAAKEGLWGIENLSYIPGEVGASAVQNIGAYGVEVKDVIHRVYCYDTLEEEFVNFSVEECGYGYRDSVFKNPEIKGRYIVTHVVFALSREPKPRLDYWHLRDAVYSHFDQAERVEKSLTPSLIRKTIIKIRKEKLPEPSVMGSAGSFFKNPVISAEHFSKIEAAAKAELGADYKVPHYDFPDGTVKVPAAWMIEQCGWKGRRSGGAAVWEKQPLVIVNYTGDAYPEEITGLERRIIASVKAKFNVDLHPEVEHV